MSSAAAPSSTAEFVLFSAAMLSARSREGSPRGNQQRGWNTELQFLSEDTTMFQVLLYSSKDFIFVFILDSSSCFVYQIVRTLTLNPLAT